MTELETESESDVIRHVETFIQRIYDMDYVFTPESRKMVVHHDDDDQYGRSKPWGNVLAASMTDYTRNKDTPKRLAYALTALANINRALALGLVTEGPGLIKKHKEGEGTIASLRSEIKQLLDENLFLKAKIDLMGEGRKF